MSNANHHLFWLLFSDAERSQLHRSVKEAQDILFNLDIDSTESALATARKVSTVQKETETSRGDAMIDDQTAMVLHRGLNCAFIIAGILQSAYRKTLYSICRAVRKLNNSALSDHSISLLKMYPKYRAELSRVIRSINQRHHKEVPPSYTDSGMSENSLAEQQLQRWKVDQTYNLFFPQGANLLTSQQQQKFKQELHQQRAVKIISNNPTPLSHPLRQILFTSNVLMTIPNQQSDLTRYPEQLQQQIRAVAHESQKYWYDHPIAVGSDTQSNELIYGLKGLSDMVQYEIEHNKLSPDTSISVLLSVSTTHEGLRPIVADIIRCDIAHSAPLPHIHAWIVTERECQNIVDNIITPAVTPAGTKKRVRQNLNTVFGVDGEYGRHYTTLKAIAPLWSLLKDENITATFKIDLDQVFPQQQLVAETGRSVSEHFMTDAWGSDGVDCNRQPVHLGLIAGALVNEQDIQHGLFTPDVRYDVESLQKLTLPQRIFNTILPQSVSTEVEMGNSRFAETNNKQEAQAVGLSRQASRNVSQYPEVNQAHSNTTVRQRIHVTGGTNGITNVALRRFRPFTPIDCGRAEDQAYLLSVLYRSAKTADGRHHQFLRYVHQPGLIMRHDKSSLIPATLHASKIPNKIGDIIRILFYSSYAQVVPGGIHRVIKEVNPFTGSFISYIPHALGYLTWALSIEQHFGCGEHDAAVQYIREGVGRLPLAHDRFTPSRQRKSYSFHRKTWNSYYDALDTIERHKVDNTQIFQRCVNICSSILKPVQIL